MKAGEGNAKFVEYPYCLNRIDSGRHAGYGTARNALAQIATSCGFDGRMLVKSSETAGVQQQYESNTDEAISASVFGSPWYMVDGESFWGQDRLDFVERKLKSL